MTAAEAHFPQKTPSPELGTSLQGTQYDPELSRVAPESGRLVWTCRLPLKD